MNLKPAIFGVAFAAVSLASIDTRAQTNKVEMAGDKAAFNRVEERAASVPGLSNWAMMLAGFAGLGLAGYRRKPRSFAV